MLESEKRRQGRMIREDMARLQKIMANPQMIAKMEGKRAKMMKRMVWVNKLNDAKNWCGETNLRIFVSFFIILIVNVFTILFLILELPALWAGLFNLFR